MENENKKDNERQLHLWTWSGEIFRFLPEKKSGVRDNMTVKERWLHIAQVLGGKRPMCPSHESYYWYQ